MGFDFKNRWIRMSIFCQKENPSLSHRILDMFLHSSSALPYRWILIKIPRDHVIDPRIRHCLMKYRWRLTFNYLLTPCLAQSCDTVSLTLEHRLRTFDPLGSDWPGLGRQTQEEGGHGHLATGYSLRLNDKIRVWLFQPWPDTSLVNYPK